MTASLLEVMPSHVVFDYLFDYRQERQAAVRVGGHAAACPVYSRRRADVNYITIVTEAGLAALAAAAQAGEKVNITHMAIGDGNGAEYEPTEDQTSPENEKWRGAVASYRGAETALQRRRRCLRKRLLLPSASWRCSSRTEPVSRWRTRRPSRISRR